MVYTPQSIWFMGETWNTWSKLYWFHHSVCGHYACESACRHLLRCTFPRATKEIRECLRLEAIRELAWHSYTVEALYLQYCLEVSTHLPRRSRVYYSQLSFGIPAACRFFTEKNLRSGSKVYLGKTSVMKMTQSTLNRLLFPLCFGSSTSDDKIAPKNITDASKLVDLPKKNERTWIFDTACGIPFAGPQSFVFIEVLILFYSFMFT